VAGDDTDRLHRPDELVDVPGREQIFLDLVGHDAKAGLFDGEKGEGLRLRLGGGGHGSDNRVDSRLIKLGEQEPGLFGAARERTSLGD
jgi:hypothetical protein